MPTKRWTSTSSTSFSTAANWSDNAAPANGDVLVFDGVTGTASVLTDLSTTLTGVTLHVYKAYAGSIGTATSPLVLDGGAAHVGQGEGSGQARVHLDFGATAATVAVYDSGSTSGDAFPPVLVEGDDLTLSVSGGSVGVAAVAGTDATGTFRVSKGGGSVNPSLTLGAGATVTALSQSAGTVKSFTDNTTASAVVEGGEYVYLGTGAHTALTVGSGVVVRYDGIGTCTTAHVRGTLDLSRDARAKTFTTVHAYRGYAIDLRNGRPGGVTFTNPIEFHDGIDAGALKTPGGVKAKPEAI